MAVTAPPLDKGGIELDAMIAVAQGIVNSNRNLMTLARAVDLLNQLQVEAVDHYMVTGWLNAATILASYSVPLNDKLGLALAARVAALTALVAATPASVTGESRVLPSYQQLLYAAQIALVERIMDVPGGTSAAAILSALTGSQSFVFEYVYSSTGFGETSIEG